MPEKQQNASEQALSLKARLVGTWRLVSYETRRSDREGVRYPFGPAAVGMLTYNDQGYMSAQVMNPQRPLFANDEAYRGSAEEFKAAGRDYIGYCGTYTVDEENEVVNHHVECSFFPNWVGTIQKRFATLNGKRLTLSVPPGIFPGYEIITQLTWERAE